MSMKGIHQYGCKYNWNTFVFALANILNHLLLGIPGLIGIYQMRNVRFTEMPK